jgi:Tfp pilus assembly protein PilV
MGIGVFSVRVQAGFSSVEIMVAGLILSGSILIATQWQASAGRVMRQAIEEYLAGVQAQEMINLQVMAGQLSDKESERLIEHWVASSCQYLSEPAASFNEAEQHLTLSWFSHPAGQRRSLALSMP